MLFKLVDYNIYVYRAMPGFANIAFPYSKMNRAFYIYETSMTFFRAMPGVRS